MTADTTIESSDFPEFEEEHYIAGSKIPNYDKYYPITKVWGYRQSDGVRDKKVRLYAFPGWATTVWP